MPDDFETLPRPGSLVRVGGKVFRLVSVATYSHTWDIPKCVNCGKRQNEADPNFCRTPELRWEVP